MLKVMKRVPRHEFVTKHIRKLAYADRPLPIGEGQTISQPYVVAWMSQLLEIKKGMKVLEIGTGSGYQAAVLADLGARTFSLEIRPNQEHEVKTLFEEGGLAVGLGTFRGVYGKFVVDKWE